MKVFSIFLMTLCLVEAISFSRNPRGHSLVPNESTPLTIPTCPSVWYNVSSDLTKRFLDSDGDCNDDARAAIRAAFHDAGTYSLKLAAAGRKGGADGSLILAKEYNRTENLGLFDISTKLLAIARQFNVGVADIIQFAAAHAIATCPGGPLVQTFVGRNDSSQPAPVGLLPLSDDKPDKLVALFKDKGFNEVDLAALIGAHTVSKQFYVDPSKAGAPQDNSPGEWDVEFYAEQITPSPGTFRFQSMIDLNLDPVVGPNFQIFVVHPELWNTEFTDAMTRLSVLGVPGGVKKLIDCTEALPPGVV